MKRFIQTIPFLIILVFLSAPVVQAVEVQGYLISSSTKLPVVYANVMVANSDIGTFSDESGNFRLDVGKLPVKLKISHIGFRDTTVIADRELLGKINLYPAVLTGEEVLVTSTRAVKGETPVAFSEMDRRNINDEYYQQDVPMLLESLPGVYAYSDAGNGIGYSYIKIRGFQQDRIGFFINGIPLNDPEAHAVYWVDHGDILATTGNVQVQRGVGNSLYGSSVFGGTVNLNTNPGLIYPGFTASLGYGNYTDNLNLPTYKTSVQWVSKQLGKSPWSLMGRVSNLKSDGYRIGSGVSQESIHLGAQRNSESSYTRAEFLFGHEVTAFSWEGIIPYYGYDLNNRHDRRYNYYADPYFNGGRRNANKDVFTQKIVSLQHSKEFGDGLLSANLYSVDGDGYYEQFKGGRDVAEYNLADIVPDTVWEVDLMRRKWLRNGYYGGVFQLSYPLGEKVNLTLGGDLRLYSAKHYGKVLEVDQGYSVPEDHKYYDNKSSKTSFSLYGHSSWNITDKLLLMMDLRYLGHRYHFRQGEIGVYTGENDYALKWDFVDPHLGLNLSVNEQLTLFCNISSAHREPSDNDIYDQDEPEASPAVRFSESDWDKSLFKEESLWDYEFGGTFNFNQGFVEFNLYYMDFRNEFVPVEYRYYDADDKYRANIPKTVHTGMEVSWKYAPVNFVEFTGNATLSDNFFSEFSGDSLGWSGWGGIADYSGNQIPGFPQLMLNGRLKFNTDIGNFWLQLRRCGKQYIDFANTEEAAVDAFTLFNLGGEFPLPNFYGMKARFKFRVNNLFDVLYETFGYNYYDDPDTRVDAYWPGATRNYYLGLELNF